MKTITSTLRTSALSALAFLAFLAAIALPLPTAEAATVKRLKLNEDKISGRLMARASFGERSTSLTLSGRVRVRKARLSLEASPCASRRCEGGTRRGIKRIALRGGLQRLSRRVRLPAAEAVRIRLREGADVLVSWRVAGSNRSAQSQSPQSVEPQPTALRISTEPGLAPEYSPEVPDYAVRCQPGEPVRVHAEVPADAGLSIDGQPPRSGRFTSHVPLDSGQAFQMVLDDSAGRHEHTVRCLPADMPRWTAQRNGNPQAEGYVVSAGAYAIFIDSNGVPVWWMRAGIGQPQDAKLLSDGTVAWARFKGLDDLDSPYEVHGLDGTLLGTVSTVGVPTDFHDLQKTPEGNFVVMSYATRDGVDLSRYGGPSDATVVDAEIQEISPSGELLWSWNSKDHIELEETGRWMESQIANPMRLVDGRVVYDIVHINSVEVDGTGVVFSARHLDAVYRIERGSGEIDWKLGGTTRPESLTFVDDPLGSRSFGGQHDARILGDGSLTVYDNGTMRGRAPRAVRYRLDTTARTATMVEELRDPRAASSFCCGSTRRLSGGNWVTSWGGQPLVSELDASGKPVFSLSFENFFSYRANVVEPGAVSREALRAGMDRMHPR